MKKINKLFLSLMFIFTCSLACIYNVSAEETQGEYKIEALIDKSGSVSSDLVMKIEGIPEEEGLSYYYVKFVKDNEPAPTIDEIKVGIEQISRKVGSYHDITNSTYGEQRIKIILIEDDWYMLEGYTKAYVINKKFNNDDQKYDYTVSEPITVGKSNVPGLTQRYEIRALTAESSFTDKFLYVSPLFPYEGESGSHELNVKIGVINDTELLKRLSRNESGSYEALMSYAKTNDGTIFNNMGDDNKFDVKNFKVTNDVYYYIYAYYTNTDGLYRNLDDINIVMGKNESLETEIVWNFEETEWEKFIKAFKNHDEVKAYTDEEISFYNDESKFIITLNSEESTFKTEFNYKNGIVSYVFDESKTEEDKLMDTFFNSIALDVFAKKFGYKLEDLSTYMQKNPNLKVDENGIECEIGSLYIDEKTENSSLKINSEYFKKLSFNWLNGVKSFENKSNTVENPKTGINIQYGVLTLLAILTGAVYLLIRKYSKFPKHN